MNKKPYEAPTVKKVRLEIKSAILAVCNTSSNVTPYDEGFGTPCSISSGCYDPQGI